MTRHALLDAVGAWMTADAVEDAAADMAGRVRDAPRDEYRHG